MKKMKSPQREHTYTTVVIITADDGWKKNII